MATYVIDTECYHNYFLLVAKNINDGKLLTYEMIDNQIDSLGVIHLMSGNTTVSFNGMHYDLIMLSGVLKYCDNAKIKKLSDYIIKSDLPTYQILKNLHLEIPKTWDHIDLIDVAPGKASLKIYGGRLGVKKLQDLPFNAETELTTDQMRLVKEYCNNDVEITEALYHTLKPQIELREHMTEQYGIDLRSKSDAQIAEAIILKELNRKTNQKYTARHIDPDTTLKYHDPGFIQFKDGNLNQIFHKILKHDFEILGNGQVKMPLWLRDETIDIGGRKYQMGIGGLHSCETKQYIQAKKDEFLIDYDVQSFYPNIILSLKLAPSSMGKDFLEIYQSLVSRRIAAKTTGDSVTAGTLKICVNGSFGKLGSKFSILYSPELLIQTTITGQLTLLMLIERMEALGIKIVSANTDGIVCYGHKSMEHKMEEVAWDWMLDTSFFLERTDYKLLAARDVNNYFAIKSDGSIKRKGCFAKPSLIKNPDRVIIYEAVCELFRSGTPIEETIRNCKDVRQFVKVRMVKGGAIFKGQPIGKAVRYYSAKGETESILYAMDNHKVAGSTGCKPIMDIYDAIPDDIDYDAYIRDAKDLLVDIGYITTNEHQLNLYRLTS